MSRIVWLASYPKSGNTWFRVFLANLLYPRAEPVGINALGAIPYASARELWDEAVGYNSDEQTADEIENLRPEVYRYWASTGRSPLFFKVHDAFVHTPAGQPLIPRDATRGALYFIRNPLDVCVSLAHHLGLSDCDAVVDLMADPAYAMFGARDYPHFQLRQRLLTWGEHVRSWVDAAGIEVKVVRYEDMQADAVGTFTAAAGFAGLAPTCEAVERALACSRFEELRRQEASDGFHEKPVTAASFFRSGTVGSWRDRLTETQVRRIIAQHEAVMKRFGYLTPEGQPVL